MKKYYNLTKIDEKISQNKDFFKEIENFINTSKKRDFSLEKIHQIFIKEIEKEDIKIKKVYFPTLNTFYFMSKDPKKNYVRIGNIIYFNMYFFNKKDMSYLEILRDYFKEIYFYLE